jgi:hypothetical protein
MSVLIGAFTSNKPACKELTVTFVFTILTYKRDVNKTNMLTVYCINSINKVKVKVNLSICKPGQALEG